MDAASHTGISLLMGPSNSGKLGRVLAWWQERLAESPVIVMPTGPDADELSAEMAVRGEGLVGQSTAVTFDGLVSLLLARSLRYLSSVDRTLLVSRLLSETSLEVFDRVRDLPGTAVSVAELLVELGESGMTPASINRALERWGTSAPAVAGVSADIRRLSAAYQRECVRLGWIDRPSLLGDMIGAAACWDRPVAFYGFTSFSRWQRALVVELSKHAAVLVAFTHDHGHGGGLCGRDEIAWWHERAAEVIEVEPSLRPYSSASITFLERQFFSDGVRPRPPAQTSGAEGVRFLLASGRQAEAELAAQTIAELIRAGDRPGEVAVVVREISEWAVLLGDVFDSCGIPYQVDCRTRLGGTGLGGAFINCLQGVMSDDAARLLAYLRSPYSGVAPSDVDDLEWRYERGTARGAGVLAALAARGCGDALRPLWGLLSSDRGACREDTGGPLLDLVEAERWARRMLVAGARGLAPGDDDLEEDIRAFRALQAAFAAMAGLVADHAEPACFEAEAALRSLAQRTVGGARPDTDDAVQLLSVHRARARRFDVVIVLGLVEGEFPGRTDRPSILSPAQRTGLSSVAGGLLTPRVDQESALFVSAVSRARRLLHLSARDAEDDGTEAVPSRFWVGAKTLLEVESQGHESRTLTDQVFTPSAAPSLRHYLRACASAGVAPDPTSGAAPFAIAERSRRRTPTRLSSAGVLEELTAKRSFSPSALERYAACPFAWFLERVVRVQEIGLELDGAAVGELLHGVLSSTYRRLAGAGLLPLRSDTVAEAERLAFAAVDGEVESDRCPGSVAQRRLAGSRLRGMVRTLFAMEISAGGGLRLSETEAEVGGSQGTDVGGLRIRGRIDRIDATPDGAGLFVIDYKSGEIPSAASMGSDAALQLPLYLLALGVERPDAQVIGGAYLSLSRNQRAAVMAAGWEDVVGGAGRGCRALDGAGMEELFRLTREHALRAAEGMRTGDISPREDRACPVWCRLGPACRSRRGGYRP